jgi:hypothetical protein
VNKEDARSRLLIELVVVVKGLDESIYTGVCTWSAYVGGGRQGAEAAIVI